MKKNLTILIILAFISISSAFAQIPSTGLVAYYPFNGNANDFTGNGHNGTVYGATLTTDRYGHPNKAYSFNGSSNWIDVPDTATLDITGSKTISAWIYVPRADSASMLWYPTIITKNDTVNYYPTYGLFLSEYSGYYSDEYKYAFIMGCGTTNDQCFSNTYYYNHFDQWMCVTGVYNAETGWEKTYIDGVLSDSLSLVPSTKSNSNTGYLCIGRNHNSNKAYFIGKIDEVAIYNRVLSPTEVMLLCDESVNVSEHMMNNNDIVAYPNPNNGNFQLTFNANQPQQISVQVYDNIGKLIYSEQKNIAAGKQDLKLALGNYPTGIYFYSLNFNGTKVYNKIEIVK